MSDSGGFFNNRDDDDEPSTPQGFGGGRGLLGDALTTIGFGLLGGPSSSDTPIGVFDGFGEGAKTAAGIISGRRKQNLAARQLASKKKDREARLALAQQTESRQAANQAATLKMSQAASARAQATHDAALAKQAAFLELRKSLFPTSAQQPAAISGSGGDPKTLGGPREDVLQGSTAGLFPGPTAAPGGFQQDIPPPAPRPIAATTQEAVTVPPTQDPPIAAPSQTNTSTQGRDVAIQSGSPYWYTQADRQMLGLADDAAKLGSAIESIQKQKTTQTGTLRTAYERVARDKANSVNIIDTALNSLAENRSSDTTLIYAMAKALDPGGRVTEGDIDIQRGIAPPWYASILASMKNLSPTDRLLTESQRQVVINQLISMRKGLAGGVDRAGKLYTTRSEAVGINPNQVIRRPDISVLSAELQAVKDRFSVKEEPKLRYNPLTDKFEGPAS